MTFSSRSNSSTLSNFIPCLISIPFAIHSSANILAHASDVSSSQDNHISPYFSASAHKKWNSSEHHERLIRELQDSTPQGGWQIDKAVCMALGSLNNHVSVMQLIAFLDMVQFLNTTSRKSIPLFAQDPRITDSDKTFLRNHLGITIIEAPNAERMIRRGVFSFVPHWALEYQLLERRPGLQPSLHVGRSLRALSADLYLHNWACWRKLYHEEHKDDKITEYQRSRIDEQRKVQMRQVEALEEDYGSISMMRDREIQDRVDFQGLLMLSMYVERDHKAVINDPWPEEVADEMLLNIMEDSNTCLCCRLPTS